MVSNFFVIGAVIVIILLIIYSIVAIVVIAKQNAVIYQPRGIRPDGQTPCDRKIPYTAVMLSTNDNLQLHAWWVPGHHPDSPVVLICHGNSGNIGQRTVCVSQFVNLGFAVFIFDYRGFGNSKGRPSEPGLSLDAHAAWDYVTSKLRVHPSQIIIVGRSLGGAVATSLAYDLEMASIPVTLILQCTFTSLEDMVQRAGGGLMIPWKWLIMDSFDTINKLRKMTSPVLIMHAVHDKVVPFRLGERLGQISTSRNPCSRFVVLAHGGHNDCYTESFDVYRKSILDFAKCTGHNVINLETAKNLLGDAVSKNIFRDAKCDF